MVSKRQFGEQGNDNLPLSNHSQSPPTKFQKVVNHVLKEESLQHLATRISEIMEPNFRKVVKEEIESHVLRLRSSPRHSIVHQPQPSASEFLQLQFAKKLPPKLYTNSIVKDEEQAPLQIMLVDGRSKTIVHHGPLSSVKVEVHVLNADFPANGLKDWTETEFRSSFLHEREGKRPLLVGDRLYALKNGTCYIDNISFTDNSSWVRSRKFRLGVHAVSSSCGTTLIKEAVSEAFVVLDHRGESYQKHTTPLLDDPVWRLKKISKMGASHKKLESHGIATVKDFLMRYHINPLFLRRILGSGVHDRTWETIVKHAHECRLDNTRFSYYNASERVKIIFNCVLKIIEVKFEGQYYQPMDALGSHQQAIVNKLKQLAFDQNELVPIQENIGFCGANMELKEDGPSTINQGQPDKQFDFNISESASYPCTVEDGYLLEDESTAQSSQHVHEFSPASFLLGDSCVHPNTAISSFAPNTWFEELSHHPQTSQCHPFDTTRGQENCL